MDVKKTSIKYEHTTINLYTDDALDKVDSTYRIERWSNATQRAAFNTSLPSTLLENFFPQKIRQAFPTSAQV